jgi:hypothetical protein
VRRTALVASCGALLVGCLTRFDLPAGDEGTSTSTTDAASSSTGSTTTSGATETGSESSSTTGPGVTEPDKWIRVAFKLGRGVSDDLPPVEEAARFDLLVAPPDQSMLWAGDAGSTWAELRALNPSMRLFVAMENPGNYSTSESIGDGWDWITDNHGVGAEDRWAAVGVNNPNDYLRWSNEYAMSLESPGWRAYFLDGVLAHLGEELGENGLSSVDGVFFMAEAGYEYPHGADWEVEVMPGVFETDYPSDYHDGMAYDVPSYQQDLDTFLDEAIVFFETSDPPLEVAIGFSGLQESEYWLPLEDRARPVSFAGSFTGILQQWGGPYNVTNFRNKIDVIQSLDNIGLLHANEGRADQIPGEGLAKMDAVATTAPGEGATEMTGWEALWFALCAHMVVIDTSRSDLYFWFSIWGEAEFHWFDEYDPEILHLGEPLGTDFELEGATLREFEDGWVAVNGTLADLTAIPVPEGSARVITHESLLDPQSQPLVTSFDLPLHRGVILLRDGAELGS